MIIKNKSKLILLILVLIVLPMVNAAGYQTTVWGSCINGTQYRTVSEAPYYNPIHSSPPNNNQSCYVIGNKTMAEVVSNYTAYFSNNPNVLLAINRSILDEASFFGRDACLYPYGCGHHIYSVNFTTGWNNFWIALVNAENNNNSNNNVDNAHAGTLAHSIWLDNHNLIPWNLSDYSDYELDVIFKFIDDLNNKGGIDYNPTLTYSYTKNYINNSIKNTLLNLIDSQGFKVHYGGGLIEITNGGTICGDPHTTVISPYIDGCHCNSDLIMYLTKNLNIPSLSYVNNYPESYYKPDIYFIRNNWFIIGHSGVIFPGYGYIPHGDNVYLNGYVSGVSTSHQTIIPWNYLQSSIIPYEISPSYSWAVGRNPGEENYSLSSTIFGEWLLNRPDYDYPTIILNSPNDGTETIINNITLDCSASDNIQLKNISFYTNISGIWKINKTITVNGTSNQTKLNFNNTANGIYLWTCQACDNSSNCINSLNRTIKINTTKTDNIYPIFYNKQDNNGSLINLGKAIFNISINNTNGTVFLNILGIHIKANNNSNNYWVEYNLINPGLYTYYWSAYGNGSSNNLNNSIYYNYIVNSSTNLIYDYRTDLISWNDYIDSLSLNVEISEDSHLGQRFKASNNAIIKNISIYLKSTKQYEYNLWIELLNDSNPSQILYRSINYSSNLLDTNYNWFTFNIDNYQINPKDNYRMILETDANLSYIINSGVMSNNYNQGNLIYNGGNETAFDMLYNIYGSEEVSNESSNQSSNESSDYSYSSCYQESADTTNQAGTDGDCNLDYSGKYQIIANYLYINYSKPINSLNATWRVKQGYNNEYNITIPDSCFANNPIQLRFYSSGSNSLAISYGQCYNNTWNNISQILRKTLPSGTSTGTDNSNYLIDGDWDNNAYYADGGPIGWLSATGTNSGIYNATIYEEGIYWNIQSSSSSDSNPTNHEISMTACQSSVSAFSSYIALLGLLGTIIFLGLALSYFTGIINKERFYQISIISTIVTIIMIAVLIIVAIFILTSLCSVL